MCARRAKDRLRCSAKVLRVLRTPIWCSRDWLVKRGATGEHNEGSPWEAQSKELKSAGEEVDHGLRKQALEMCWIQQKRLFQWLGDRKSCLHDDDGKAFGRMCINTAPPVRKCCPIFFPGVWERSSTLARARPRPSPPRRSSTHIQSPASGALQTGERPLFPGRRRKASVMEATFMTSGAPKHEEDSLPSLPAHDQTDVHLTAHIASRFHVGLPINRLSSHALVTVNTYVSSTKGPNGGKEGSAMAACEKLAARLLSRLAVRAENQAVIFLGDSGGGKTTLRSHLLSSILSFDTTPVSSKLSYAAFLFDTLTTTKTATSPTASKAGLFFELQYDTTEPKHASLVGGKLLDHRLERSRITSVPTGERNFHALYYLLAGTSPSEKSHLGLDPGFGSATSGAGIPIVNNQKRWRYLGHPTQLKVGINDSAGFDHFKTALRKLNFSKQDIAGICQVLATVLHVGQLEFHSSISTTPTADESGGYGAEGGECITTVKNRDTLGIVAAFLGVNVDDMEMSLGYKTRILHGERVTIMLDPNGARENADEIARTLYSLLTSYIVECINTQICIAEVDVGNTLSIVDFPGFAVQSATGSTLDQLLTNAAAESLYHVTLQSFFERTADILDSEEINVPSTRYFDNSDAVRGLARPGNGLLSILDDQMRRGKTDAQFLESCRKRFENKNPAISCASTTVKVPGTYFETPNSRATFTVRHFAGEIEYPVHGLLEENNEIVSGDLFNLVHSSKSTFVRALFKQDALHPSYHPDDQATIMQATLNSNLKRQPSRARRKAAQKSAEAEPKNTIGRNAKIEVSYGASGGFVAALDSIIKSISAPDTNSFFIFCLKPNDRRISSQFDSKCVRAQLQTFGIPEISQRLRNVDFSVFLPYGEFFGLAKTENIFVGSDRDKSETIFHERGWAAHEARAGSTGVLLSERYWISIAGPDGLMAGHEDTILQDEQHRHQDADDSNARLLGAFSQPCQDNKSDVYLGGKELYAHSDAGISAFNAGHMFMNMETRHEMAEQGNDKKLVEVDDVVVSGSRKRWVFLVYLLTWYVPDVLIRLIGRIPRKDVRMAWREKLAINLIIWFSCGFVIFFIVILPQLICPRQFVYTEAELSSYNGQDGAQAWVGIRGVIFDLDALAIAHYPKFITSKQLYSYAGRDATALFPVQVSALCPGKSGSINDQVSLNAQSTNYTDSTVLTPGADVNAQYHDFRFGRQLYQPTWFSYQMISMEKQFYKGNVGWPASYIQKQVSSQGRTMGYINGRVYDLSVYLSGSPPLLCPLGETNCTDPSIDTQYMDFSVVSLFTQKPGQDLTQSWQELEIDQDLRDDMLLCLNNLFYVGNLDTRNSARCLFARYMLLAVSMLLVSVIGFKFLAALQFGGKNMPENINKFILCTIPAYTEDEGSLRRAIDSAARMKYDDKLKLLFIVCDGMIVGQGNDRSTPRIVLDILGVSDDADPESLSFESLGEGQKQHNMGKVYSGLYEVQGHIVPFLVVVKIGRPSEMIRPGNRGKRDSQMILMRFLNRVHHNLPMNPLELEMHHHIRNIIGVNPSFYEFLLQIDADTVVAPDSASRMISAFLHDTRLIAVCGETALTNAKASFVAMMQVYEYYISHNLTKAFESLFGSVTCLPGCFTMYRIRAADSGKPLFVSSDVVESYSRIRVDTLHMKNLLHLGEDRYLTTLLLKFHSKYKTKYIFRAKAWTIAPESWQVFMSQRRRWINSTVHNLIELIPLQQLCGFCCFSMRFVVFLDLMSTIVQPVIVGYIVYLIVVLIKNPSVVPVTAFILIGAIYGLQAIIFILRRKWEMIGWMLIYLLATPVFAFGLPLYAFWHMDDFSWGNTRVVTGEKGRHIIVSDEGKFDPETIPRKRWQEYQAELWKAPASHDDDDGRSVTSGLSYDTRSVHRANGSYRDYSAEPRNNYASPPPSRPLSRALPATPSRQPSGGSVGYEMTDLSTGFSTAPESVEVGSVGGIHGQPSDDALLAEIREFLSTADLMTVTKKSVLRTLEARFGVSLEARKMYISSATEAVLAGQL